LRGSFTISLSREGESMSEEGEKSITVYVPFSVWKALREMAYKNQQSISSIAREAIINYLISKNWYRKEEVK
jgi:predicted transcriptional regulator